MFGAQLYFFFFFSLFNLGNSELGNNIASQNAVAKRASQNTARLRNYHQYTKFHELCISRNLRLKALPGMQMKLFRDKGIFVQLKTRTGKCFETGKVP